MSVTVVVCLYDDHRYTYIYKIHKMVKFIEAKADIS